MLLRHKLCLSAAGPVSFSDSGCSSKSRPVDCLVPVSFIESRLIFLLCEDNLIAELLQFALEIVLPFLLHPFRDIVVTQLFISCSCGKHVVNGGQH